MSIFDTHAHIFLHKEALSSLNVLIERFRKIGGSHILMPSLDIESSQTVLHLSQNSPTLFSAIGLHPLHVQNLNQEMLQRDLNTLEELIKENRTHIYALGETGIDDYHTEKDPNKRDQQLEIQKISFLKHIEFSKKYDLPLIVHSRNAPNLTYDLLQSGGAEKFVIHCFCEDLSFAEKIFSLSPEAKISFTGVLTYPNAGDIREVVKESPLNRMMIETDTPYLPPQSKRSEKVSEPSDIQETLDMFCSLRDEEKKRCGGNPFSNKYAFF